MAKLRANYNCSLELAMDIVGGKWKMVILWHLRNGVLRFGELRKLLCGITQKMLTQQLRELEELNLIVRKVYPVVPPKVEYSLAEQGTLIVPVLAHLCQWSSNYAQGCDITIALGKTNCCLGEITNNQASCNNVG